MVLFGFLRLLLWFILFSFWKISGFFYWQDQEIRSESFKNENCIPTVADMAKIDPWHEPTEKLINDIIDS